MKLIQLSIIILAGNEEKMIEDCLKSCLWANEIILVAANSSDRTIYLAKKICSRIIILKSDDEYGKNFSKWRNQGLEKATNRWLFYLDADERMTSDLKSEIINIINSTSTVSDYYAIPRANFYLGHRVKYGGSYPDYVKRLYLRSNLRGWRGILHEEPITTGKIGYLKEHLLHYTHRDLTSMLQKTLIWTESEAQALFQNHHPPVVWWRIIRMMFTTIWKRLIIQQMWRDGTVGLISVIFETFDTFIIYARLWEIQHHES